MYCTKCRVIYFSITKYHFLNPISNLLCNKMFRNLTFIFKRFFTEYYCMDIIQSAKILLISPKYEIIMVPSNHSSFQYCDSNIGLFSIAPCYVITLNPLCILFCYQFFASFLMVLCLKLSLFQLSR